MKKKILIAIALVVLLIGVLCACSNKLEPGDSTILYNPKKDNMEIVKDMDAYDLIKKAYTTYQNSSQYKMEVDFIFKGKVLGSDLYQNTLKPIILMKTIFISVYSVKRSFYSFCLIRRVEITPFHTTKIGSNFIIYQFNFCFIFSYVLSI